MVQPVFSMCRCKPFNTVVKSWVWEVSEAKLETCLLFKEKSTLVASLVAKCDQVWWWRPSYSPRVTIRMSHISFMTGWCDNLGNVIMALPVCSCRERPKSTSCWQWSWPWWTLYQSCCRTAASPSRGSASPRANPSTTGTLSYLPYFVSWTESSLRHVLRTSLSGSKMWGPDRKPRPASSSVPAGLAPPCCWWTLTATN